MDYKKMNSKELLHLISNQVSEQQVSEQNKLVIQDCCKELFNKKCKKYVKITYQKWKHIGKRYKCPAGDSECPAGDSDSGIELHPIHKCDCCDGFGFNRQKVSWHTGIYEIRENDPKFNRLFCPNNGFITRGAINSFEEKGLEYYLESFGGFDLNIMKIVPLEI